MFEKGILKWSGMLTLFCFVWFCVAADLSFAQSSEKDALLEARRLSQEGNFDGAIKILKDYIEKLKIIKEQKQNLAKAYYSLARTYHKVGEEALCDENLRMVFMTYRHFSTEENDFIFKDRVDKTRQEVEAEIKAEEKRKAEERKAREELKAREKQKPEKEVIAKPVEKKKKKKFPWLLAVGGVVVVGVILYLLLNKKDTNGEVVEDDFDPNYDTEVLGIEWIHIPEGEFMMGDNFNEGSTDERPVHAVNLDSYYISKYEVTFEQYDAFCDETFRSKPYDLGWGRGNRPVITVSWHDANAFCTWLSVKTGIGIFLPTEAQWEKAARGTGQLRYPWGNSEPNCNVANYNDCYGMTRPVGSYPSGISPYGVYDMGGNVWEWCSDWYSATYYAESPYNNPTGPASGDDRVKRGGSWNNNALKTRCASRYYTPPSGGGSKLGFRICRDRL
jgi:formylglycine-generating enzyme required for sulfatase activity